MMRAILYALAVLFAVDAIWILASDFGPYPEIVFLALYGGPFLASVIAAYLAPRHRIALGTSMAVPSATLISVLPTVYGALGGRFDSVGLLGQAIFFLWFLLYTFSICVFGAALGNWLAIRQARRGGPQSRGVSPARTP